MKNKENVVLLSMVFIIIFTICIMFANQKEKNINYNSILTSSTELSNTKIGWGIKRALNHNQPDLGNQNKEIINKYKGIAMGSKEKKYVYLTFDEGYEAGYTPKILEVLKQNNVKATFFITAHYVNTQENLVKQMIDENHTVGNHIPIILMTLKLN